MVAPTLGAAFTHAIEAGRNLGPRGMPVTLERATQVFQDGRVEVNGVRIPVTGSGARGLRAGEMVAVSWQRGQPVVAIRHSARRTGPVSPQLKKAGGVVEELILGPPTAGSSARDFWFRNDVALGRLGINTILGVSPSGGRNSWGLSRQHMVVRTLGTFPTLLPTFHVFTLGAADGTPRAPEQVLTDVPIATLDRTYVPHTSTMTLGQYTTIYGGGTFTFNPPIVLGTLLASGYSSGDGGVRYTGAIEDWMVDERGHLLISVNVVVIYRYLSVADWFTLIPYVVDLTDEVIIFDGLTAAPALFGVTAHSPLLIDIDTLPDTGSPNFSVIDPFAEYRVAFLHAAAGEVSLIAGADYRWVSGTGVRLSNMKTKVMVRTPLTSVTLRPLTTGDEALSPTVGLLFVSGLSAEYVFWIPFESASGQGGLQYFLPTGSVASSVKMTRFVEPTETEDVSTDLDAFFAPRLQLLDPTALYNTTDANDETGHYFVEFLDPDGALALDAAATSFPVQDERPGEKAGFLLDYPPDVAFLETYLASIIAGETPINAFLSLVDQTHYQLILDTAVVPELPI